MVPTLETELLQVRPSLGQVVDAIRRHAGAVRQVQAPQLVRRRDKALLTTTQHTTRELLQPSLPHPSSPPSRPRAHCVTDLQGLVVHAGAAVEVQRGDRRGRLADRRDGRGPLPHRAPLSHKQADRMGNPTKLCSKCLSGYRSAGPYGLDSTQIWGLKQRGLSYQFIGLAELQLVEPSERRQEPQNVPVPHASATRHG
jgi:hypothetical protein